MMIFGESLRVIGQGTVLAAERKIKALRDWKRRQFERRRNLKCGIEMGGTTELGPKFPVPESWLERAQKIVRKMQDAHHVEYR